MTTKQHIAFFGLGAMGEPMVENLANSGDFVIHAWNRTHSKAERLAEKFKDIVIACKTPEEAIGALPSNAYVLCMLFDHDAIVKTLFETGADKPLDLTGKTLLQMSTVSVEDSKHLEELTAEHGGNFIPSPVLGTNSVAQAGKLQVLLGCSQGELEQIEKDQLLTPLGTIRHIADKQKVIQMKLSLNFMVGSLTAALANGMALVDRSGLDMDMYLDILRTSAFYFKYIDMKAPRMLSRDYSDPNFTTDGLLKDFKAIEQVAQNAGVYDGLIRGVIDLVDKTAKEAKTGGSGDMASIYDVFNPPQ